LEQHLHVELPGWNQSDFLDLGYPSYDVGGHMQERGGIVAGYLVVFKEFGFMVVKDYGLLLVFQQSAAIFASSVVVLSIGVNPLQKICASFHEQNFNTLIIKLDIELGLSDSAVLNVDYLDEPIYS
jgi:hypothetical protein